MPSFFKTVCVELKKLTSVEEGKGAEGTAASKDQGFVPAPRRGERVEALEEGIWRQSP